MIIKDDILNPYNIVVLFDGFKVTTSEDSKSGTTLASISEAINFIVKKKVSSAEGNMNLKEFIMYSTMTENAIRDAFAPPMESIPTPLPQELQTEGVE